MKLRSKLKTCASKKSQGQSFGSMKFVLKKLGSGCADLDTWHEPEDTRYASSTL